ncbi:MAG: nitronate monooxygenase [Burkholderiales bacterium]|nr:MAG: nitronate monooxygenase [Burkholderiales bacterium]
MSLPAGWASRLRLPLIAAPMTAVSGPALARAACRAGVIGSFPSHNARDLDTLDEWLSGLRATQMQAGAPLAVNLVVHASNRRLEADLACVLAHGVELIITSVGNPASVIQQAHAKGCRVFADVASLRHVDKALAAGVDGLVLLTAGAGGQTGWLNPFAFVRAVRQRYDGPVVLAGGIADGASLRAAEVLGADLAYMGTKFIATTESLATPQYKQALVDSNADDIELTLKASGLPANVIRRAGSGLAGDGPAARAFDQDRLLATRDMWSAGHSVVGVHEVLDVSQLVEKTIVEYEDARQG